MIAPFARPISCIALTIIALSAPTITWCDEQQPSNGRSDTAVSYHDEIRPILQANCHGCHQPAKSQGDYVMTSFDRLLSAGESEEPAIVPGKPDQSYLVNLITPAGGEAEMPQEKKPLSDVDIALITRWIEEGAVDDTPAGATLQFDADDPPKYVAPPVITSLDFSPDGKLLAVAAFHEVLLHRADGSGIIARLVGMSERIESVRFSPNGKLLAVTGGLPARLGEVQVWDVETQTLKLSHTVTYDTVYGASWSPDGKLLAFGCADNTVRAIDAETGEQVLYQGAHNDFVLDTVFSQKGTHLISVSRDRSAKLTEIATQRFVDNVTSITPGALKGGVNAIARHPTRDEILLGGADGEPKVYRVFRTSKRVIGDDANLIRKFPPLKGRIFSVAFSHDGRRFAAGSCVDRTGEVRTYAYDIDSELPKDLLAIMQKRVEQRTPEEKEKIAKYHSQGVQVLATASIPQAGIFAVAFGAKGKIVAAAGSDGLVRLLDAESGSIVKEFVPVPVDSMMDVASEPNQPVQSAVAQVVMTEAPVEESLPPSEKIAAIQVQPANFKLSHRYDTMQFVVTARMESGSLVDVTRLVDAAASGDVATISPTGLVRAKANGKANVMFSCGGKTASAVIEVEGFESDFHADLVRDVMPVFGKAGCNAGVCHGSKKGKGGLKTSLRGNDPIYELRAYTDELASRRINLASPENSLMLLKATATVPHKGGQVLRPGTPHYEIVRKWIAEGAEIDRSSPRVTDIEIFPKDRIMQPIDGRQQYRVLATYTDGELRDVTADAFISVGDIEVARADDAGLVAALRRGESPILARFEGRYDATTLTVMGDRTGFVWKDPPANSYIDELVAAKLNRTQTAPSELSTDAEFIRRAHLDLLGLPPTADDVRKFLADKRDTRVKRDELIDRLIGSDDYVEHWANKWADLLQVNRKYLGVEGSKSFRKWIREQVAANTPYDKFVHSILTASGSNREHPAASYFKIHRTPEDTVESSTQLFLGVRFSCNKCHDHPFERWVQDQYWETAAYFAQVGLKKDSESGDKKIGGTAVEGGKPLYEVVFDKEEGEVLHDETGAVAPPKFPYPVKYDAAKNISRREHFARWAASPNNQYFAKSYVNRLWGYLLGVGFIEPLDDIRAGNPPTNPELLDRLTREFIDSGFDVQNLVRRICKSRTYQLSIETNEWNEDDTINYSHATARRLTAEVLYDAIHLATGSVSRFPGVPEGTRAAELPDVGVKEPSGFLAKLGRPARESVCECERTAGMQLGPVIALVSGSTVDNALIDPEGELTKLVAAEKDNPRLIDELFLRILNRSATDAEIQTMLSILEQIPAEHEQLVAELKAYDKALAPKIAEQEKQRQAAIVKTKAAVEAHEMEIAPREAELDKQQKSKAERLAAELKAYEATLPEQLAKWEREKLGDKTVWTTLDPHELSSTFGAKLTKEKDRSIFVTEKHGVGSYNVDARTDLVGITAVRIEALADKRLPKNGPGRAPDGNFVVSEVEVKVAPESDPANATKLVLRNARADFSQQGFDVKTAIDGKVADVDNGWGISPQAGVNHTATFEFKEPIGDGSGSLLTLELKQTVVSTQHTLGRFRISVTTSPCPVDLEGVPPNVANLLLIAPYNRNAKQIEHLLGYFRTVDEGLNHRQTALAESKKPRPIDPKLKQLRDAYEVASQPLPVDLKREQLQHDVELSARLLENGRLTAAQDLAWALINSPAFLFNR